MKKKYLVVVSGPTGIGKSKIAESISDKYKAPILSADSRQMYRQLNIGTAKPDEATLAKYDYYFINNLDVKDTYSAGDFEKEAIALLERLFEQHSLVICCGGTGLYIKALLEGLDHFPPIKEGIKAQLMSDFDTKGIPFLQDQIRQLDPVYADRVDMHNPVRLIRALAVCLSTDKPYSQYLNQTKKQRNFDPIVIRLKSERSELYERINLRVDRMMDKGLLAEVKSLTPFFNYQSMQSVGYQELIAHLNGSISLDESIRLIKRNSRRYAKRQITWLNKQNNTTEFTIDELPKILAFIKSKTNEDLEK